MCSAYLLFTILSPTCDYRQADASQLRNYVEEYRKYKCDQILSKNIKVTREVSISKGDGKPDMFKREYARKNDEFMISEIASGTKPYFYCRNSRYFFELADKADGSRIIANLVLPAPNIEQSISLISDNGVRNGCLKRFGMIPLGKPMLSKSMTVYYYDIDMLVELADFKAIELTKSIDGVKIEFQYTQYDIVKNRSYLSKGSVLIDDKNHCNIKSQYVEYGDNEYKISLTASCETRKSGIIEETKVKSKRVMTMNGKIFTTNFQENATLQTAGIKSDDFSLSHFGFAEPLGSKDEVSWNIPWFVYASIAGILCILLSIYIATRNRK